MFRSIAVLSMLMGVVIAGVAAANESERRASRYEHMNMDLFFNSRRMFSHYVDCLLGKKNCPPEGLDLKRQMPSLLKTYCQSCTPRQREIIVKIFLRMQEDYQPQLKALLKKWDPSGQHYQRFLGYVATEFPDQLKNRINRQNRQ